MKPFRGLVMSAVERLDRSKIMASKASFQRALWRILPVIALMVAGASLAHAQAKNPEPVKNIVLVHGGFVDGSGWESVYKILTKKGYHVTVVQNPTISLEGDVTVTKRAIDAMNGPVILVGHSYGGAVISQAGTDPNVVGLVYITAFALDNGESVGSLLKNPAPGATPPPIMPPQDGFLLLDREKFPAAFAGDVNPEIAAFMAASQVPWGLEALNGTVTDAAWKTKPSWYLITTEDRMIPPDAQRFMSKRAGSRVVAVKASHSVFLSHPDAVASLIEQAAVSSPSK
ncbi:Pimeloyl-ACP methyl ester carboxylesterase [Bryocella elongata]|uniref:Pimeloyl-ACP methyl ester carboxylesterase n=1 Tax=Bryocella elongata TaxID=863522 RepID=A0A1H6C959_9BACT|nr:alpha/beta hydrolase [Bryocella elongata]SEG69165.1 Pimeloyl-ACP methyl ester carboxylesterase [Bryocella elongata]